MPMWWEVREKKGKDDWEGKEREIIEKRGGGGGGGTGGKQGKREMKTL